MSKANALENGLLLLLFNNVALGGVGDAGGLQPAATMGDLWLALHTADPGEGGGQDTDEVAYAGYTRIGVTRDVTNWAVSGNTVTNDTELSFPACTGGAATVTHFSIGTDSGGAGKILYSGQLFAPLNVSNGITPKFAIGSITITED